MKYYGLTVSGPLMASPPSRGAWIEIEGTVGACVGDTVAPLAGGVD